MLESLHVWNDLEVRSGFENMAVDELLWETGVVPLLRTYRWDGHWLSLGYFSRLQALKDAFPSWQGGVVRRPTGGGIVDHRHDWTYSLFVPRGFPLAEMSAADRYRFIHSAIAQVMQKHGASSALCGEYRGSSSDLCFEGAVANDVLDHQGNKIAGAGQRRGRSGLLHQGSISHLPSQNFAFDLASVLSQRVEFQTPKIDPQSLEKLVETKYASNTWTAKK